MTLVDIAKEVFTGFLQELSKAWWVEISTTEPQCIYYFGPFSNSKAAHEAYPGYVEDLQGEGARDIKIIIKRCNPKVLTVFDEEAD